ncbi:MAG: hypothetical protein JWM12_802, partial [Ilumatobacteraceae bacterium]|nr:hypothetical protein [Ilumatobacteraceae bacterium]
MIFTRLGRLTVRHRRLVLAFTALFVVIAGALGTGAFDKLHGGGTEDPGAESSQAGEILAGQF